MSALSALDHKIIDNPIEGHKKHLKEISDSGIIFNIFSKQKLKKEVARFGLELLKLKNNYYNEYVSLGSEDLQFFKDSIKDNLWDDKDYYELLIYFFGQEKAAYVKDAWKQLPYKMYQTGYTRRSFRAPENSRFLLVNQINFIRSLIEAPHHYTNNDRFYDLTLEESIRYDNEISNNSNQFMIWSAALNSGNTQIYKLMEDIVFNKDSIGKVSRGIIKALLNSYKKECWELVEKLLLAAQRQEGLRQTILESLDETSIGALGYMINVIVENKLARFSSVVRAIDTWTGLGWEAEKEPVVRNIIQLAQKFFENPDTIKEALKSKNNNDVYMALWVQGVLDVERTVPYLHEFLDKGTVEKKCLALKFAAETNDPYIEMPLYFKALNDSDLQVLAFTIHRMQALLDANSKSKYYIDNKDYPDFFDKVYNLTQKITTKEKLFESIVFSWLNAKFERDTLFSCAIHLIGDNKNRLNIILSQFDDLSLNLREKLTRNILGDLYCYSYYNIKSNQNDNKPTNFQREFALKIIKERGDALIASAINTLNKVELSDAELNTFQVLYKRKNSYLKKELTSIILKHNEPKIKNFVTQLAENGDLEQRMSALDIMLQLRKEKKLEKSINQWVGEYSKRAVITDKEKLFLEQLLPSGTVQQLSAENGYGFYKLKPALEYKLPEVEPSSVFSKLTAKDKYGFTQPMSKIRQELDKLQKLYIENSNYEYEIESWDNSRERVLLGNIFRQKIRNTEKFTAEQLFQNYPLSEIWQSWMENSGLAAIDLFLLNLAEDCNVKKWKSILQDYVFYNKDLIPNPSKSNYYWDNPIKAILDCLTHKFPFEEKNAFLIDACAKLFANLPNSVINYKYSPDVNFYYSSQKGNGWQAESHFNVFLNAINDLEQLTDQEKVKLWQLYRWRQFNGLQENIEYSKPPFYLYCDAYSQQIIAKEELYEGIIDVDYLRFITDNFSKYRLNQNISIENLLKKYDFLQPMIDAVRNKFLDIEIKRGDSNTPVTKFVKSFQRIFGVNRFMELINGIGKSNLYKGYIYSWNNEDLSKHKLFSYLLKRCYPLENETYEDFVQAIKKFDFSEERLIQAAIYAPQWQKFISRYIDWTGLDEGIWWLHAHTKTASYSIENSELESEIAKYTAVDLQDFKDGAVDKDWFLSAYKKLGKAKWNMLYEAAKYVSEGNGHRRARLYSDTLTGDLKIKEVVEKVKDKRDQDYLRVYGLVPLSKSNPEKDVLARYEYILQFKKESKEFGSMKQSSEAVAIRVALENLARNAGYPDPVRLTWAMETRQVQNILSKETQVTFQDVTVGLEIDKEGKAELITYKDGKELKAIPSNIKKEPAIIELSNYRKVMREQWSRSRKGLEEAMVRGDEFMSSEIVKLFEHPVISKHLEKLVFISGDNKIGFYVNGSLVSAQGKVIPVIEGSTFRVAHCYDMHLHGVWTDFQSYCFDKQLKQPFKQVFRELYLPTPDEISEKSISRRYAGHQVQPKQTLALLKTRGWKVDYEEGLQKVFHKEGYHVKLYAMADWFSPSDIESPTLETIIFHSLKDYSNIELEKINQRVFSEVMRDVDLVVSVAHVGGVDPEASHSSIEMRAVLLRETLRLFKLKNVEITENHAIIKGALAEYSVHLGSAVVHQMPGKYISILPVHSQHRGRLFLPFADDDPKSAEIMSKVLLLAKDNDIQDPTILSQIDRK